MDNEWRKSKTDPPPENILVEIKGDDRYGDWVMKAKRIDYKGTPLKRFRMGNIHWRWVGEDNHSLCFKDQAPVWRYIKE